MKDKKRVLTIILSLIAAITIVLIIVHVLGGKKAKALEEYYNKIEAAACKYAKKENITQSLCQEYTSLCKVRYSTLVVNNHIKNLRHPLTGIKTSEDKDSYVEITWDKGKMICTRKDG